jgi:PAS domain S-box-containing protein/putative nucleotidyltransferase with HDIG domain
VPDIITRFDRELRHLYVNPVVERVTGIPASHFIGKTNKEMGMPIELCSFWAEKMNKVIATGQPDKFEFDFQTPDGMKFYQSYVVPEFSADGSVETILVVARDLTDQRQAERDLRKVLDEFDMRIREKTAQLEETNRKLSIEIDERKKTEMALRESRQKLITAQRIASIGDFTWNLETGDVVWSDAMYDLIGYDKIEKFDYVKVNREIHHPNDLARVTQWLNDCISSGQKEPFRNEYRLIRKDGIIIYARALVLIEYREDKPIIVFGTIQDITEQKQAEQELRVSEKRYHTLFETMDEGFCVIEMLYDTDGKAVDYRFVEINPAFEKHTGLQQALGKTIRQMVPDHDAHWFEIYGKVAQTGEAIRFENPASSMQRYYDVYAFRIGGDESQRVGVLFNNITRRKQAEHVLKESERVKSELLEKLNEAQHIAKIGSWEWNLQTNNVWWSDETYRIFGVTQQDYVPGFEVNGKFIHPDDLTKYFKAFEHSLQTGEPLDLDVRLVVSNGSLKYCLATGQVIYDDSDQPVRFVGTLIDITERKRAEKALQESEQKYRSIFENAVEGIFQTTPEGRFLSINQSFARLTGYLSPEELIEHVTDLGHQLYVNSEDREQFRRLIEERGIVEGYEAQQYRKDGSTIWVSINARSVYDEHGAILYYEGTFEDITKRKQAEESLQRTMEKLRKSLMGTIQALSSTVETRDPYTAGHQRKVSNLARTIAQEMRLSNNTVDIIRMAGIIHDIGKISVPAEILSKPGKLSDMEFNLIKTHSQTGYDILKDVGLPYPIAEIVLQHHERLDGSGYPQGLKGDQIFIEARIISIADTVEAISSHRPYRPGLGIDVALEEIVKNKGILYDPEAVEMCLKLFREKGFEFE